MPSNKKNKVFLSVVLPVYNRDKYLKECIESIINQTYPFFELIIIDDGSTDKSADIIKKFMQKDKRIKLISFPKNGGISRAINTGIKKAKANIIVRVDSDDICLPTRFEEQINYLNKHSEIGVLGSQLCLFKDSNPDSCILKPTFVSDIYRGKPPVNHPTCMIKKKLFKKYGYFNPKFNDAEDFELWHRFFANKVKFVVLPQCLYKKRYHPESGSVKRIRHQVYLMLKINFMAIFKHKIKLSFRGYLRMLHYLLYLIFLSLGFKKIKNYFNPEFTTS